MSIEVKCPWCRAQVEMEGDRTVCPKCGHEVTLARAAAMDPLPPPPAKEISPSPREREGLKLTIAFVLFALVACIFLVRIHTVPPGRPIANEAVAISTLRTIQTAQENYHQRYDSYIAIHMLRVVKAIDVEFKEEKTTFRCVPHPDKESSAGRTWVSAGDTYITTGGKSGYDFTFRISGDRWNATAVPAEPGKTGKRSFYIDQTGTIRSLPYGNASDPPADAKSPALGG